MLDNQPYVRVFGLDFSKAVDTVKHDALMKKMARLALPDAIYNWINDFFKGHSHCTKFLNTLSRTCRHPSQCNTRLRIGSEDVLVEWSATDTDTNTDTDTDTNY